MSLNMKKINNNLLIPVVALMVCSCAEKVNKDVTWPEWASRPVISDVEISAGGRTSVAAGESVVFKANVRDDYNDLASYSLTVEYGDYPVLSKTASLSGSSAELNIDLDFSFAAGIGEDGIYPEITLSVRNVAGGEYSTKVAKNKNVLVVRPELPSQLNVVDESGNTFILNRLGLDYNSEAGADFSKIGTKIYIAEKVSGGKPDFSGLVWGTTGGGDIAVVTQGGSPISVPDTEGYGFSQFGFDTYSFEITKTVNLCIDVIRDGMSSVSQSGVDYLTKENVRLVKDCQVKFSGFGNLESMLQSDRFEIIDDSTVKFTGHSANWSFFYDTADNWMILNYAVFNKADQLWITGAKACFPLGDDNTDHELKYLDGDGKVRYASLAAIRENDTDYSIVVYLKEGYTIQPFRWVKWSTTVNLTSLTPETASIVDNIFICPGSNFTPGLYRLLFHFTKQADSGGDGSEAEVSVTAI